jgi:hypothetical protein
LIAPDALKQLDEFIGLFLVDWVSFGDDLAASIQRIEGNDDV